MKKSLMFLTLTIFLFYSSAAAQTKSLIIPSGAFHPSNPGYDYYTGAYLCAYAEPGTFVAPVYLPEGAKIIRMVAFFQDAGAETIAVRLWQQNLYNGQFEMKFELYTAGSTSGQRNQSETGYAKINNSGYKYYIWVDFQGLGTTYSLYAVKLIYNE